MNNIIDYYKLLHVQRDAPSVIIKASYRTMMQKMQHHPDLGGDEHFAQQLNLAVSVLCDTEKRSHYDKALAYAESQAMHRQKQRQKQRRKQAESTGQTRPSSTTSNVSQGSSKPDAKRRSEPKAKPDPIPVITLPTKSQCPFCKGRQPEKPSNADGWYATSLWCFQCGGATTPIAQLDHVDNEELRQIHRQVHTVPAMLWHSWPQSEPVEAMLVDFFTSGLRAGLS